jgi:hypothetical protein
MMRRRSGRRGLRYVSDVDRPGVDALGVGGGRGRPHLCLHLLLDFLQLLGLLLHLLHLPLQIREVLVVVVVVGRTHTNTRVPHRCW